MIGTATITGNIRFISEPPLRGKDQVVRKQEFRLRVLAPSESTTASKILESLGLHLSTLSRFGGTIEPLDSLGRCTLGCSEAAVAPRCSRRLGILRIVGFLLSVGVIVFEILFGRGGVHAIPLPVVVLAPVSAGIAFVGVSIIPRIDAVAVVVNHSAIGAAVDGSVLASRCPVTCRRAVGGGDMASLRILPVTRGHGTSPLGIRVVTLRGCSV